MLAAITVLTATAALFALASGSASPTGPSRSSAQTRSSVVLAVTDASSRSDREKPDALGATPMRATASSAGHAGPQVALFTAIPAKLPAHGGRVRLIALVQGAASCRFMLTRPDRKLLLARSCSSGDVLVNVRLAANSATRSRVYGFTLRVRGDHGRHTTAPVTVAQSGRARAAAPKLTGQPHNETVAAGARASFTATASANPAPHVQWQQATSSTAAFHNITAATAGTLSFTAASGQNGYLFRAVFTNSRGTATSAPATLTIGAGNLAPQITAQPQNATVAAGSPATFTASASGIPPPTVQWQVSSDGFVWTNIGGATSPSYSTTANAPDNGHLYRAVFTNASGSVTTAAATLTEAGSPQITEQPAGEALASNANLPLTATATGSPAPTVQWQISLDGGNSWGNISGATSQTYTVSANASENFDEYRAVFTNDIATATSNPAVVTVGETAAENWSGYADSGGTFSAVAATWTVPAVNCTAEPNGDASQWIGIDGYTDTSDTVEQDGTETDCTNGSPSYGAWYEMYGDAAVNSGYAVDLPPSNYPLSPGDTISARVSISGSAWTLSLDNASAGWNFQTNLPTPSPAPQQSSAEWIVERPTECAQTCGLTDLTDFAPVHFSAATATDAATTAPISAFSPTPIEMAVGSRLLAAPSALDNTGELFSDSWYGPN